MQARGSLRLSGSAACYVRRAVSLEITWPRTSKYRSPDKPAMSDAWFYVKDGAAVGPMPLAELVRVLSARPEGRQNGSRSGAMALSAGSRLARLRSLHQASPLPRRRRHTYPVKGCCDRAVKDDRNAARCARPPRRLHLRLHHRVARHAGARHRHSGAAEARGRFSVAATPRARPRSTAYSAPSGR